MLSPLPVVCVHAGLPPLCSPLALLVFKCLTILWLTPEKLLVCMHVVVCTWCTNKGFRCTPASSFVSCCYVLHSISFVVLPFSFRWKQCAVQKDQLWPTPPHARSSLTPSLYMPAYWLKPGSLNQDLSEHTLATADLSRQQQWHTSLQPGKHRLTEINVHLRPCLFAWPSVTSNKTAKPKKKFQTSNLETS